MKESFDERNKKNLFFDCINLEDYEFFFMNIISYKSFMFFMFFCLVKWK